MNRIEDHQRRPRQMTFEDLRLSPYQQPTRLPATASQETVKKGLSCFDCGAEMKWSKKERRYMCPNCPSLY